MRKKVTLQCNSNLSHYITMGPLLFSRIHFEFTIFPANTLKILNIFSKLTMNSLYLNANSLLWINYQFSNLNMKPISWNNHVLTLFVVNSLWIHYVFPDSLWIHYYFANSLKAIYLCHELSISRSDYELTICVANLLWTHNHISLPNN